jgi:hypothetical protein
VNNNLSGVLQFLILKANNLSGVLQFLILKARLVSVLPDGPTNGGKAKSIDNLPLVATSASKHV